MRRGGYELRLDHGFETVIRSCAAPTPDRPRTWLNEALIRSYTALADAGFAHSVEIWRDGALAGGLYGVRLGGAFFGESMFSVARDASKVALAFLVARLKVGGFRLLDAQFVTEHLTQFGAQEVPQDAYLLMLDAALAVEADFYRLPATAGPDAVLQAISQAS